jgi:hypothetical protein
MEVYRGGKSHGQVHATIDRECPVELPGFGSAKGR